VRSVHHAAAILKALRADPRAATLSDLARRVGLSKPAALSLLRTLLEHRLVARDASLRYRLDWGTYELGSAVSTAEPLIGAARFEVDELARRSGQAALVSILHGGGVLYVDTSLPGEQFRMAANDGKTAPLHATASGKVLLAHQSASTIRDVLRGPLPATTSRTITDPQGLGRQLDRIRRIGYATCHQEFELGLSSIAVPVHDSLGETHAALAVAGPSSRFSAVFVTRLVDLLTQAAGRVQTALEDRDIGISRDRTAFVSRY
jgi:DNA-binding IclR family transcriptional regulator